jgi:heme/copper-type cytochrome/quinol oxidase subunit 2
MNTSALILMVSTILLVTGMLVYFIVRVLTTPPNPEPDSFLENDAVEKRKQAGDPENDVLE